MSFVQKKKNRIN